MTIDDKQLVLHLHVRGFKNCSIARQVNRSVRAVYSLINDWKLGKFLKLPQRRQRRSKLTAQQVFLVLKHFVDNPFHTHKQCIKKLKLSVTAHTIGNLLTRNGIRNYVAYRKQFLTLQNQIKRLKFAIRYEHWTTEWLQVYFIDEKTVQTYANGRVLVKRKINQRYDTDKIVASERQNSKKKVNLVGAVSYNGPNIIYSVSTKFTGEEFEQLVETKIETIVSGSTVVIDNARIHLMGINYLRNSGISVLDFPPKSPDFNVIENVWAFLQRNLNRKLQRVNVATKEELLAIIEESWKEIPVSYIKKCILSMPNRLKECIKMKGRQTKY